jgi:hypothetical protein
MQMNDSQSVPASRQVVWAALNDPDILRQCIPGCQTLEMTSPTEMIAKSHHQDRTGQGDLWRQGKLKRSRSTERISDHRRRVRRGGGFCKGQCGHPT